MQEDKEWREKIARERYEQEMERRYYLEQERDWANSNELANFISYR